MLRPRSRSAVVIGIASGALLCLGQAPSNAGRSDLRYDVQAGKVSGKAGAMPHPSPALVRAQTKVVHERNLKRLAKSVPSSRQAATSRDVDVDGNGVKDLAVVVDNGRIIVPPQPANPLDLTAGLRIRFTPVGTDSFLVTAHTGQVLDPALGASLSLGDDDFAEVPLTTAVPFLGASYTSAFVGSDGHVTFGAGDGSSDPRDAARHIGGPPRVSALLTDLDPTCRGSVHADPRADRLVVTWDDVVHFERGFADGCAADVPGSTLQLVLHAAGAIDLVYGALDAGVIGTSGFNRDATVGVAEGAAEGPLNEIDLTAPGGTALPTGAIFEQFTPATPETFDIVELGREFYKTHPDHFDNLVMFTDFPLLPMSAASAFFRLVQNRTLGIGRDIFDASADFGSAGELEGFIWMNNILSWAGSTAQEYIAPKVHDLTTQAVPFFGAYQTPVTQWPEFFGFLDITGTGSSNGYAHHGRTLQKVSTATAGYGPGSPWFNLNSPISIMYQEADHRWSASTAFVHPTKGLAIPDSFDLLGRSFVHWSTFFNTQVVGSPLAAGDGNPRYSGMEGNALVQLTRSGGAVRDKNNPGRVVADPQGELGAAMSSCQAQGKELFLTEPDELVDGATQLDQYLMGVRTAGEVAPFWYVDEPSSPLDGSSLDEPFGQDFLRGTTFNVDDIAFCGIRVNLTVDNITQVGNAFGAPNGARVPAIGDENDVGPLEACFAGNLGTLGPCADVKTMAFVLLVRNTSDPHTTGIRRLNEFRKAWQQYVDGPGLGGRNADGVVRTPGTSGFLPKFDTSLEPRVH